MPARRPYDSASRRENAARNRAAVIAACRELLFRDGKEVFTGRVLPYDPGKQTDMKRLGAGGRLLGEGREEGAERHIVGAGLGRFHGQVARIMAGDTDHRRGAFARTLPEGGVQRGVRLHPLPFALSLSKGCSPLP